MIVLVFRTCLKFSILLILCHQMFLYRNYYNYELTTFNNQQHQYQQPQYRSQRQYQHQHQYQVEINENEDNKYQYNNFRRYESALPSQSQSQQRQSSGESYRAGTLSLRTMKSPRSILNTATAIDIDIDIDIDKTDAMKSVSVEKRLKTRRATKSITTSSPSSISDPVVVVVSKKKGKQTNATTKTKAKVKVKAAETKTMIPCPTEYLKKVWFQGHSKHKLYEPVIRAFHSRGWSVTKDQTRAHVLWRDQPINSGDLYTSLQPWQRFNQFPMTDKWDDKDEMALHMYQYYQRKIKNKKQGKHNNMSLLPLHSFPESYVLHLPDGLEAFRIRLLEENGGLNIPWVLKEPTINQGKGVTILGPQSKELESLVSRIEKEQQQKQRQQQQHNDDDEENNDDDDNDNDDDGDDEQQRLVIQRYICDEMTFTGNRKFDVRVFWTVASIDPLLVLYHTTQNYVRIGHAQYDESDFSSTKSHLTTHTFGSGETKATWDEFREYVERHVYESQFRARFYSAGTRSTIDTIRQDPFGHVQNQMKTIIGHLSDAYKNITFNGRSMVMENGFSWHAADMIIDNNLDVFIIEGTDGPGKDEDYDFRITMHDELLGSVVDIVEDVVKRQEQGRPLDVNEMKENGIFGRYEVVYNDGWMFDYRYERLSQRGCAVATPAAGGGKSKNSGPSSSSVTVSNLREKQHKSLTTATPKIVPATFTALPKKDDHNNSNATNRKTFWMKSRTNQRSEPVARSLRHNGWTPVDKPEQAQLVYYTDEEYGQYKDKSRLWQHVSQFPSQYSFFQRIYQKYLGISSALSHNTDEESTSHICQPILRQGRPFTIIVYWVVLSLEPLRVLYHDGYVYFDYSQDDENEFITLRKKEREGKKTDERIWQGSWKSFEHYINTTHADLVSSSYQRGSSSDRPMAAAAAASIRLNPMSHVRNQMKQSLVKMAEGFKKYTVSKFSTLSSYSSFALFTAEFNIDQNLNTLLIDSYHSFMEGEDHSEMVYLHDDLYGSAFQLLDHFNSIKADQLPLNKELLGRYEWLIRVRSKGDAPEMEKGVVSNGNDNLLWKFKYPWKHKAKQCLEL